MSEAPTRTQPVRIDYSPGVVLSIPIVADRDVMDRLYEYAQTASGADLTAAAKQLGITPPSTQHRWSIGWSAPSGSEPSSRLVWYDPDKLAGIDAMVGRIAAERPHVAAVTVVQGAGWNDWAVAFSGETHPYHGDGDAEPRTEPLVPARAACDRDEAVAGP